DDTTLLEIGRKKYLNRTEFKDAPLPFFPSEYKALKQRGLTLDDVEEVKAGLSTPCTTGSTLSQRGVSGRLQCRPAYLRIRSDGTARSRQGIEISIKR